MSTRGIYGFRVNGTDKLAYCHADSYPDMLGATVLNQLSEVDDWPAVKSLAESIVPIHETRKLGQNDEIFQAELRRHYPDLKYDGNPKDFYDLLSPLQGSLEPYLSGRLSFMPTANEFIKDSLSILFSKFIVLTWSVIVSQKDAIRSPHCVLLGLVTLINQRRHLLSLAD